MRVGIVSPGEVFGGVERQILDLCQGFARLDAVEARPVLFHDRLLARYLREIGQAPSVCDRCAGFSWRSVRFIREWQRTQAPDLLHLHGYKATVTTAAARLAAPVVVTVHGLQEPQEGGRGRSFRSVIYHRLDRMAVRGLKAVVCYVTDDIRRRYRSTFGDLPGFTVHNGIVPLDRHQFPRPTDLPRGMFHVGVVGRITPVKGIDFALRALAHPEVPSDVVLDIVGEGPSRRQLEHEARRLGIAQRVRFLGFKDNIYDYLAHLDVMLIPSRHEGLPYTLLEAMSLSRPIVASRVGGLAELLEDARTAILVDVGAVEQIATALVRLHDDSDLAGRLGRTAAFVQRESYTREKMIEHYRMIYEQAAEQ